MFPQPHGFVPHNGGLSGNAMAATGLEVRPVTAANYEAELDAIGSLLPQFPVIVFDTEYPGTVHRPPPGRRESDLTPPERYALIKANVDEVPILQLGITLCDADGNLPVFSSSSGGAAGAYYERSWVFTFSDFDARRGDAHAPESVTFLRSRGVDFAAARTHGVSSAAFAARFAATVLAPARITAALDPAARPLTWAAYGGAYDYAYMVKMLSGGQPLPGTWHEFMARARELLGSDGMFDAKYMAEHSGHADDLFGAGGGGGGLRRVAAQLGESPLVPEPPFLAGPKCRAACRVYTAMRRHFRELYLGLPLPLHFVCHDHGACFDGLIDGFH
ncbi:unnamed protein product [Urochloa decumbens]|uniref:poly(A)-specific ribonuclease n=1 Tax=Urochloa decumbens TaxID=240449 RepID=A0ABC9AGL7_9POAL